MKHNNKQIVLEGRNMVRDALNSPQTIETVLISSSVTADPKIGEIQKLAQKKGVRVQTVKPDDLNKYSESRNPQGVVAIMSEPDQPSLEQILKEKRDVFVLLLNGIDYEQNMGAILRSAWGGGVDAVIASPNGVHKITSVVAKVSMGAAAFVPLIGMSLFQAIKLIHDYAVPLIGIEVLEGKSIYETNLRGPVALMLGGEEVGLSEPLMKECDTLAHIPMNRQLASLNVSVATAICLFEKRRQEKAL